MTGLTADHFSDFLEGVHGVQPYPWQVRLARRVIETGHWPSVLDLPTGVGKTTAIDIALFHLAVDLESGARTRAPVRIAFVVDRRIVVDDALARAERLKQALENPPNDAVALVAELLRGLAGPDSGPLVVRGLRGGIPREDDWASSPVQPTILCSTVDQVGSRLLFRGYGVSDSMKPVHAGLLGSDCLILLDEAHIAEPFRQTLKWVERYRGADWRTPEETHPWGVALLTATPGQSVEDAFELDGQDREHPRLQRVLRASKPVRLVEGRTRKGDLPKPWNDSDLGGRIHDLAAQVNAALSHFADGDGGVEHPAVAIVVNRVARARAVYQVLKDSPGDTDLLLLIGPARSAERANVVRMLDPIRTGADRVLDRPLVIIATQCIEVGVDIDLDALITEAAPLDALRQRFGRLNRAGREISPWAAIVARKEELSDKYDDPVYGQAIRAAWERLEARTTAEAEVPMVDFGILNFDVPLDSDALTRKDDAPVLLPRHVDLLHQTSPRPNADPDVGLFLHGVRREPDSVSIVWRADLTAGDRSLPDAETAALLSLAPPRAAEAITLPVWTVRKWLAGGGRSDDDGLSDTPAAPPPDEEGPGRARRAFRWSGAEEGSQWIHADELRPGDSIVVPSGLGGLDRFGWFPKRTESVRDIAARAARPFAGRRWVVRVHPELIRQSSGAAREPMQVHAPETSADPEGELSDEAFANALAEVEGMDWTAAVDSLLALGLTQTELGADLQLLRSARRGRVECWFDIYARDAEGRPGGAIFVAPRGVALPADASSAPTTENDVFGSFGGVPVPLEDHLASVAARAEAFAARLPQERARDVVVAARLHDVGKADLRFQRWMHYGDPLGPDLADRGEILAKSGQMLPRRVRAASGLPDRWRHEALSVRLATMSGELGDAADPDLVLWLIGTHHGYGRPFFPHADPDDQRERLLGSVLDLPLRLPAGPAPQSLAWEWGALDWSSLAEALKSRYGVWQLAMMEAVLRLADHRASAEDALGGNHGR